jgi:hypothetical protein
MKKNTLLRFASYAAMALGLAACDLAIENPTDGDTRRVLGSPADAEALLSTYYKRWSSGVYGSTGNLEGMANVLSLMNYSSLANNCQNNHWPFSNASNGNTPGNVCGGEQARLYQFMNEVTRVSSSVLQQMDDGLSIGNTNPATDARNLRARAFGEFLRGLSLGYLALMHDSSSIVSPKMATTEPDCVDTGGVCAGALRPYTQVMDSAYAAFDRAIGYATTPTATLTGTNGFPIPDSWLPSPTIWTSAEFVKLIRSYKARFRANVARTAAETIDWQKVVDDARAGITADHYITTSTTTGPGNSWRDQYNSATTWHQMPPFIIGMADQSGSYQAWIAQPLGDRGAGNVGFFMVTQDLRFPQGATRAAQQADFAQTSCEAAATACKRYFVNRQAASDQFSGVGWGWSNYDFVRFRSWSINGDATARNGKTVFFTLAELDMLQAEGLYRLGPTNDQAVADLINKTRTRGMGTVTGFSGTVATGGGLPQVLPLRTGAATGTMPNCIPKVPAGSTVSCGDLLEALKYEKRIETAYTHYAPWYLDGRRWNDLPKDTPLFWAVPYQELQARGRTVSQLYGTGPGVGNAPNSTAPGSAYGW